jgi:hypothetical protein
MTDYEWQHKTGIEIAFPLRTLVMDVDVNYLGRVCLETGQWPGDQVLE